jgi:hypothetical protein
MSSLSALGLTVSIVGCAGVIVAPVKNDDVKTEGVRYYQSEPYLLVTKDSVKATYSIQLIFLPNYNKGYAVRVKSGLGSANGSVKLGNGWQLTEFGGISDTKIPETITALTSLVKEIGTIASSRALTPPTDEKYGLLPGLYRLKFNPEKGYFEGWEPVLLFPAESK